VKLGPFPLTDFHGGEIARAKEYALMLDLGALHSGPMPVDVEGLLSRPARFLGRLQGIDEFWFELGRLWLEKELGYY